jgi:hypothetical protein
MDRRLFLAGLLALPATGCTLWPERKNPDWQQATGAERFEQLYWKEWKAKNWLELEARTASNFTLTTPQGTYDKAQALAQIRRTALADYSLGDFQVVDHGSTAIVHYVATYATEVEGRAQDPVRQRRMSVWQQQKSGWVLVAESVALASEKP